MDTARSALMIVDIQPDFLPGGALAVAGGDRILPGVARLMESELYELRIATQDWHPSGHVSFASNHPGRQPMDTIELYGHPQLLWPDHCVQGTPGAELRPDMPWHRVDAIIRKATCPGVDSYSAFRNNWDPAGERPPTGLAGLLSERGIERVFLCGLARDYCVRWSAEDAVAAGFETWVIWDLTRSVDPAGDTDVRRALEALGVHIIDSGDLAV